MIDEVWIWRFHGALCFCTSGGMGRPHTERGLEGSRRRPVARFSQNFLSSRPKLAPETQIMNRSPAEITRKIQKHLRDHFRQSQALRYFRGFRTT